MIGGILGVLLNAYLCEHYPIFPRESGDGHEHRSPFARSAGHGKFEKHIKNQGFMVSVSGFFT